MTNGFDTQIGAVALPGKSSGTYISIPQAASILGVSRSSIYKYIHAGQLRKYFDEESGNIRVDSGEIQALFVKRQGESLRVYYPKVKIPPHHIAEIQLDISKALGFNENIFIDSEKYPDALDAGIWVLRNLDVSLSDIGRVLNLSSRTLNRRYLALTKNPPGYLVPVIGRWRLLLHKEHQYSTFTRCLKNVKNGREIRDYITCRLLGSRHVQGICKCVEGLYGVTYDETMYGVLVATLKSASLLAHKATVDTDIARIRNPRRR